MRYLTILLMLSCVGCKGLNRIIGNGPTEEPAAQTPSDYVLTGTTVAPYQIIAPVRTANSVVTVKVLRKGETDWHTCNRFEVKIDTTDMGRVTFEKEATLESDGYYHVYGEVAPVGTKYEIHSVLKS